MLTAARPLVVVPPSGPGRPLRSRGSRPPTRVVAPRRCYPHPFQHPWTAEPLLSAPPPARRRCAAVHPHAPASAQARTVSAACLIQIVVRAVSSMITLARNPARAGSLGSAERFGMHSAVVLGQRCGDPCVTSRGGGAAPLGAPARSRTRGPGGAGRAVAAAARPALAGVLRDAGHFALLASRAARPALDLPACPARPATRGQTDP